MSVEFYKTYKPYQAQCLMHKQTAMALSAGSSAVWSEPLLFKYVVYGPAGFYRHKWKVLARLLRQTALSFQCSKVHSELQITGSIEDNSKIIFLISQ